MTWQDYEKTVTYIYETLGENYGVKIIGCGPAFKRRGKSGVDHQIDVLTKHTDGIHSYETAIECKYWNDKVTKDIVMKVISVIEDCNIDKAVIVTKKGFTPDTITFAKFTKVQLVELKEYNFSRRSEEITKYYAHIEIKKPLLISVTPRFDKDVLTLVNNTRFITGNIYDFYFRYPDNTVIKVEELVLRFLNDKVLKKRGWEEMKEKIKFPGGTMIKKQISTLAFPIHSVTLTGYNEWFTTLDQDYFESKIWLLMKVLFEDKYFIMDVNKKITERKANQAALKMQQGTMAYLKTLFFSRNLSTGELKPITPV